MQKVIIVLMMLISSGGFYTKEKVAPQTEDFPQSIYLFYTMMNLEGVVDYSAFEQAMEGYQKLDGNDKEILTLIDFSKPSTEERLYVLDLKYKQLLYTSLVAHGRNSGDVYATSFSNKYGSYKSSLGFYKTGITYHGGNGYSLVLNGLEKGINDRARERAIVVHGSNYCNTAIVASTGRLGRSLGCPALPRDISKQIINIIKDGTLLYIYADDEEYLAQSPILSEEIPMG